MKIAVVGNGDWNVEWGKYELADVDYLICADGGANSVLNSGCWPDLVIGDFDSLTLENQERLRLDGVRMEQYPREKDKTDLELALACAVEKAEQCFEQDIWLYGATGLRADHFLGNISLLLYHARQGRRIRMVDPQQEMWVVQDGERVSGQPGQEISLIPLSERVLVSTEGLYYSLSGEYLYQDSPRGISNVLIADRAMIQVHEGWLLLSKNQMSNGFE